MSMDNHNNDPKKPGQQPPQGGGNRMYRVLLTIFLITIGLNLLTSVLFSRSRGQSEIEYSQFLQLVESGNVDEVSVQAEQLQVQLTEDADLDKVGEILQPEGSDSTWQVSAQQGGVYLVGRVEDPTLSQFLYDHDVAFYTPILNNTPLMEFVTSWVLPIILIYLVYTLLMRSMAKRMGGAGGMGGIMGVGKSRAKEYNLENKTGVSFDDVAGQDEAKESLSELVDYLKYPKKYEKIGAKQPKGALLVGPPGTGKTLLAKALAGEAGVPFYSLTGSEFVEMFVGVGASRVRDLFDNAKKNAPCIIFIDEIDAIGKSRDNQLGSNDEREQTLNQLLSEMDGFDTNAGIIVLAATNRPDVLDKALLRPGRFDRRVIVEKPDLPGREAILQVHAKKVKMLSGVSLKAIAQATPGATGADLANMINEAALRAVRMGREAVTQEDLMESVEVVIAGKEKKDRIMNPKEKRMVAYHEVGHALISALQKNSQPVQKITIVPRTMGSLGYTMNMPEEERYLMTRDELVAEINTLLGGRAAELVEFDQVTTGASNDIERATKMARGMVTQYGMSEKFGAVQLESTTSQYLDGRAVSQCSEETEALIDQEVQDILKKSQAFSVQLLQENRPSLEKISNYLLEKENITGEEFMRLLEESRMPALSEGGGEAPVPTA